MERDSKQPLQRVCLGIVVVVAAICTLLVVYMAVVVSHPQARNDDMFREAEGRPLVEPIEAPPDHLSPGRDVEKDKDNQI